MSYSENKMDAAGYAHAQQDILNAALRLTTAIERLRSEVYCAPFAIVGSGTSKTILSGCLMLQNIANDILVSLRLETETEKEKDERESHVNT
jgi:hypothetical protein